MSPFVVAIIVLPLLFGFGYWWWDHSTRTARELGDARAEARRAYDRLGGQVMNLHGANPAARQALVDAGERYNAAGGQLEQARTVRQYELARETAQEGLIYIANARAALGLAPEPAHQQQEKDSFPRFW